MVVGGREPRDSVTRNIHGSSVMALQRKYSRGEPLLFPSDQLTCLLMYFLPEILVCVTWCYFLCPVNPASSVAP